MEEETTFWASATNWIVAHGSVENFLSVESSASPIEECVDTSPKDHVLLKPSSPDSGPCEIKISFRQKCEVRQIYVRSNARVYEIYYAPDVQSTNEYLCTVRCGIAAKEDTSQASDFEETISANLEEGSTNQLIEEKVKIKNNSGTNEDDWVQVKVPYSPSLDTLTDTPPREINEDIGRSIRDFYEATAEITDSSPCVSLTLRLLSLQTKGCVYLDEIYIFVDPVEDTNSEHQMGLGENTSGSSLMAAFLPTLLQLSKNGIGRMRDTHVSDTREGQRYRDTESKEIEPGSTSIGRKTQEEVESGMANQLDVKIQHVNGETTVPTMPKFIMDDRQEANLQIRASSQSTHTQSDTQVPGVGCIPSSGIEENDSFYHRLERSMDQLIRRVGNIESFCSKFEDNMLKPLCSMETRLERVEKQLEVLTARVQSSGIYSCTGITAPEFSCNESESNLFNDRSDDCNSDLESSKRDIPFQIPTSTIDDISVSIDPPELHPALVVTAPEFSNGDDVDNDSDNKNYKDVSSSSKQDCTTSKPSLSINDALASALAGFLSSTSIQSPKYTQTLIFTAPDFTNETDDENDNFPSSKVPSESASDCATCFEENGGKESIRTLNSTSFILCLDTGVPEVKLPNDNHIEQILKEDVIQNQHNIENTVCQGNMEKISDGKTTELQEEHNENLPQSLGDQVGERVMDNVDGTSTQTQLVVEYNDDKDSGDNPNCNITCDDSRFETEIQSLGDKADPISGEDGSNGIVEKFNSVVDFELPILEVKFSSQEKWIASSSLEALLNDMSETNIQISSINGSDDVGSSEEKICSSILNVKKLKVPVEAEELLVEVDNVTEETLPSGMEGEQKQDPFAYINQEPFTSLT